MLNARNRWIRHSWHALQLRRLAETYLQIAVPVLLMQLSSSHTGCGMEDELPKNIWV